MECKKITDFDLSPDSLVKFTKTNNRVDNIKKENLWE